MVEIAPRAYRSELRARQALETRERIVSASARLFATQGYQATTIAAIAREAGVSAETVKTTASKAELLIAAFEVTFSGSEGAETLADTEVANGLLDLPDDVFLDTVLTQITTANARGHGLWTVLLGAALSDPVVDEALRRILEHRSADYRGLVSELRRRDLASPGIDDSAVADALSFLLSPESYQQLVTQSGWTSERYAEWLRRAVHAEIAARS
ncbi:MAG: helix-turn-helix domain-containing protein [Rhodoglobus sp.]|uniref:TetR/AcrR family transcriptional regulator n=1 Tax=Microbacterium sp. KKR3/1 TaxID=2904241 RepID=UPI000CC3ED81|nr:TetR/AcrR family transcriptional regulator [Microbacterium sp. KKR3/1]MCE0509633.1 TetR/AcrR family transcriptional regulator [Microbacterium sp. KKR3/1]MDZ4044818.1 helix-turn-helix domain-containing protein [Rhodoglobus sp.]PKQ34065.1 MAG: TetR family transcriptional regulator [Actinobacteria bacterium HGW-Actinobacteria-11]